MRSFRCCGSKLFVAAVIAVSVAKSWRTSGPRIVATSSSSEPGSGEVAAGTAREHVLERYLALDTLAAAVFQTGMAIAIGGVTIGLTIASRYREIVLLGSIFPLCASVLAVTAMVNADDALPDLERLAKKRREVSIATGILIGGVSLVLALFLLLLALTEGSRLLVLLHIVTAQHASKHPDALNAAQ
jgi:hypothetical protein